MLRVCGNKYDRPQLIRSLTTILSAPDSGVHTSPLRPWIWRTLGRALDDLKLSNFPVAGSKRSITCALHSAAQTLSVSSTYTA
jgi:hypothetical protein